MFVHNVFFIISLGFDRGLYLFFSYSYMMLQWEKTLKIDKDSPAKMMDRVAVCLAITCLGMCMLSTFLSYIMIRDVILVNYSVGFSL